MIYCVAELHAQSLTFSFIFVLGNNGDMLHQSCEFGVI